MRNASPRHDSSLEGAYQRCCSCNQHKQESRALSWTDNKTEDIAKLGLTLRGAMDKMTKNSKEINCMYPWSPNGWSGELLMNMMLMMMVMMMMRKTMARMMRLSMTLGQLLNYCS